jgi:hypothetical protein
VNSTATALLLMNSVAIDVAKITSDNTNQGQALKQAHGLRRGWIRATASWARMMGRAAPEPTIFW